MGIEFINMVIKINVIVYVKNIVSNQLLNTFFLRAHGTFATFANSHIKKVKSYRL